MKIRNKKRMKIPLRINIYDLRLTPGGSGDVGVPILLCGISGIEFHRR
jgi:hypothetical protein